MGGGRTNVVRPNWTIKQDKAAINQYNTLVGHLADGRLTLDEYNRVLDKLKANATDTAKAAIQAANGGTVALDKLGAKFNWAALKAQALKAAVSMGIGLLVSLAASTLITLIDNYIRRVEIVHEATAQKIADHEKQKSSIASLNDSLDGNYGMYN
ncbi:MAG: hypothetical protein KIG48_01785 [Eubacteriales bacterium]|nr:hypothetical protein [Eubacteriales bacterium]